MIRTTTLLYVRTPVGRSAAFSPEATLTPDLKAMLKAVDGKTSVSALVIQFPDQDAADLLGQLEGAGLIKLREERLNDFQSSSRAGDLPATAAGKPDAQSLLAIPPDQWMALPALPELPELPAIGLARIVDVMSTFVLTHLPQQAFTVLGRLEAFKTLDQLEAELPDYAVLANSSGSAGVVHMADIVERVREAAAA